LELHELLHDSVERFARRMRAIECERVQWLAGNVQQIDEELLSGSHKKKPGERLFTFARADMFALCKGNKALTVS
jgi:hypothetical protein